MIGLTQANVSRHLGLMYQASMLSRRREGNQIFYRVADPMYVELCRTVSTQVSGRSDRPSFSPQAQAPAAAATPSRPGAKPKVRRNLSANQKEEASV